MNLQRIMELITSVRAAGGDPVAALELRIAETELHLELLMGMRQFLTETPKIVRPSTDGILAPMAGLHPLRQRSKGRVGSNRDLVARLIAERGPMTLTEIYDAKIIPRGSMTSVIEDQYWFMRNRRGLYELTEEVCKMLASEEDES